MRVRYRWSVAVVLIIVAGCGSSTSSHPAEPVVVSSPDSSTAARGGAATNPCGASAEPPATYRHIVVVINENRTWSSVGGVGFGDPSMPYLHSLAEDCATFAHWNEIDSEQNSLTQYIGLTSGRDNPATVNDCSPSATCRSTDDNIFRQVRRSGGTARTYVEDARGPCSAKGNAAKHIPALYYSGSYTDASGTTRNDQDFCADEVRPLSELDVGALPTFAMIVPSLCNDGHDCGNDRVDAFAASWVEKVLESPGYASGDTAVMVLYDEDRPVPNLLVAPTARPGNDTTTEAGHVAMLAAWEEMLGLPALTSGTPSLRGAAHL